MEQTILRTRRGHRSRVLKAERTLQAESQKRLREQQPEKFDFNKSSPSAHFMHYGFQLSEGFAEGQRRATKRYLALQKAKQRLKDSRIRSYEKLYLSPLRRLEDQVAIAHEERIKSVRNIWRDRRDLKQWEIEAKFYDEYGDSPFEARL